MLASPPVRAARLRIAGLPSRAGAPVLAAGVLCFCAVFFSGGFAVAPLVWIGGSALLLAALVAAAALLGVLPAPRLDAPAAAFLSCLFGLAVWVGASTTWSLSPERLWIYTNLTLVYAGFALLGVLVSALVPRAASLAGAAATLLGLLIAWALLEKCVPSLY